MWDGGLAPTKFCLRPSKMIVLGICRINFTTASVKLTVLS